MKHFGEQFKKKADSIRLSASERGELRERLSTYMEYHPLKSGATATQSPVTPELELVAEPFRTVSFSFSSLYVRGVLGALAVFLVVGVPMVAERSLPGDVLYPVKVKFNEGVIGTLSLSPYEKIEWETERLGRRIAEARLLASEGKLTEEFEAEVAEAVKAHSDAAQREIETLRATDAEEAAIAEIALSSALEVQSTVLKFEEAESNDTVSVIAGAVEAERTEAEQNQAVSEAVPSVERLLGRIEQETTRAYELLETVREYASEQEILDIERRLTDIERKIGAALQLREQAESDEADVRALLRESLQKTQKLIVFMTDIDVRETVVVEDLVPVELTDEERRTAIDLMVEEIDSGLPAISAALASSTQDAVISKAETVLTELDRNVTATREALAVNDIETAELTGTEAYNLYNDLATLLAVTPNTDTTTSDESDTEPDVETSPETESEESATSTPDTTEPADGDATSTPATPDTGETADTAPSSTATSSVPDITATTSTEVE